MSIELLKHLLNDKEIIVGYRLPKELLDEEDYIEVENRLQCANILQYVPTARLKSNNKELQERINMYNKSKNLTVFFSPLKSEMG